MSMEPADRLMPGQGNAQVSNLRCPFCNADGVEIRQVRERRSGLGGQNSSASGTRLFEGAIFEFQAFCPRCTKKYRQTCADNLLPEGFSPTV